MVHINKSIFKKARQNKTHCTVWLKGGVACAWFCFASMLASLVGWAGAWSKTNLNKTVKKSIEFQQ